MFISRIILKFLLQKVKRLVVETSINIIRNSVIELTPNVLVSLTEVRNTIRSLRLTKSAVAGPDQINNRLLKKLPRKAIVYQTHIMNACFKYSYFSICLEAGKCYSNFQA
jgi:hypothetical protein